MIVFNIKVFAIKMVTIKYLILVVININKNNIDIKIILTK